MSTTYPSVEAWQEEAARRFGTKARHWAFECPACKRVTTIIEFVEAAQAAGDTRDKNRLAELAAQECIGRVNGRGVRGFTAEKFDNANGCDWAAYGLFRIGDFVPTPDGKQMCVFPFAAAAPVGGAA